MKKKICFLLAMMLLLMPSAIFAVQATDQAEDTALVVSYLYDAEVEGGAQEGGTLSFAKNAGNYLRRYTTLTWDATLFEVTVNAISKKEKTPDITVSDGVGSCRIEWAGEYSVKATTLSSGESASCVVTMMPIVKINGEYLMVNSTSGKFWRTSFNAVPNIVCENADKIEFDMSAYQSGEDMIEFLAKRGKRLEDIFGEHTLKLVSGAYSTSVYIDVYACLVETGTDPNKDDKNCLVLTVGDFGEDFSVFLDNERLLAPGVHTVTAVGQHTISATKGSEAVSKVSPPPQKLKLQVQIFIKEEFNSNNDPLLVLDEPCTFDFSKWDAVFYVNGEPVSDPANCRADSFGENVIEAYDEDGNRIENAFLLKTLASDAGVEYTRLVIEFENSHMIFAIMMMVPAVAMILLAIVFFLRRRRIV